MRRTLAAAFAALLIAVGLPGPAWAATRTLNDGFEWESRDLWDLYVEGDAAAAYSGIAVRSGSDGMWLEVGDKTSWASAGRRVYLSPALQNTVTCIATVWMRLPSTHWATTNGVVNIEVIHPTTWDYMAFKQVPITTRTWTAFNSPAWTVPTGGSATSTIQPLVRVSALGTHSTFNRYSHVWVDDLKVTCAY